MGICFDLKLRLNIVYYGIFILIHYAMEPDMIIVPHILLKKWDTIRIPQPQWEDILATVLWVDWGTLRVEYQERPYIFHWGFFVENEDWSYLPYNMDD